jgi:PAS domain S-box-containing protein
VTFAPYHDQKGKVSHVMVETKDISREKEMEDRILQTDNEVLSIVENSTDYFWSIDRKYEVLFANKLFQEAFFGFYKVHLNRGINIIEALPPNEQILWKKRYDKALNGKRFTVEHSYLLQDHIIHFDVAVNPVLNEAGETVGASCVAKDITEKKLREEQIRMQSEDLGLINKLNHAVNSGLDLEKILAVLNRESKKMFGGLGAIIYLVSDDQTHLFPAYLPYRTRWVRDLEGLAGTRIRELKIPFAPGLHYHDVLFNGKPVLANTPGMIEKVYRDFIPKNLHKKLLPLITQVLGLKSIYTLPLITKGNAIGVLDISRRTYFLEQEVQRIKNLAEQVTLILKRKLDEESLSQNERRFRLLFESANDAIFIMQRETFIDCNEKTLELFRCEKEDILGRTPFEFSPPRQPNGSLSETMALAKLKQAGKGDPLRFDWKHKRLDGSEFFTEVSLNPIAIGKEKFIQAIVRDISIRKESEALLRESEERFRAIFEDAPDAIFLANPQTGHIMDANLAACKLIGYEKERILGKHHTILYPPGFREKTQDIFQFTSTNAQRDVADALFVLRSDGTTVPVEIQSRMIKIGGRELIQGAFRDISDRYQARQDLLQQQEILRETQRIAHLGSIEIDVKTRATQWSEETCRILGYDPVRVVASFENFKIRVHPDDWPEVEKQLNHSIHHLEDFENEFRIVRPSGEERYILSKAELKKDVGGRPLEFIGSIHDLTEIRLVEKALMQSEEKFRTLFMEGHFPMMITDAKESDRIQPNKAFVRLLGYTEAELNRMDIIRLTHPDDRQVTREIYNQLQRGHSETIQVEKRYIRKDGTIIWGQTGGAAIKNSDGSIAGIIIMIIDVTGEKLAERQIKERNDDLALINNLNLQANSNLGLETILQFFSQEVYGQFNRSSFHLMVWADERKHFELKHVRVHGKQQTGLEKIMGESLENHIVKPNKRSLFWKRFMNRSPWFTTQPKMIRQQLSTLMDMPRQEGRQIELKKLHDIRSILNFPLIIGDEILGNAMIVSPEVCDEHIMFRLSRIMEQFTGILKRKLVEEEEAKLFTVVEQLTETVIITDTEGVIEYANPAFEKSSGFSRKESLGKTLGIIKSGKQNTTFYKNLWKTIKSGESWSGTMVNMRKDGSLFQEEVTISPIKNEQDRIVNYVAVKRDITKEKLLEAQLIQAQKLETVGTLAGGIAHDFNNILGTLLGYNEMVLDEIPENAGAHAYLVQMKNAMNRAKSLVTKILTFSRKMDPEMQVINVDHLLEETIGMFRSVQLKNVELRHHICTGCNPILADPSQIQQVIMNLLTNANQALRDYGGTIDVGLEMIENNESLRNLHPILTSETLVKLTIQDDGPGMEQRVMDRMFEPFFTTKPVGDGTGLGLSVVHGIIMSHHGAIEVDSLPGKGTQICIYLQTNKLEPSASSGMPDGS